MYLIEMPLICKDETFLIFDSDNDECTLGTHSCSNSGVCINAVGAYTCDCTETGYTGTHCTEGNIRIRRQCNILRRYFFICKTAQSKKNRLLQLCRFCETLNLNDFYQFCPGFVSQTKATSKHSDHFLIKQIID